MLSGFGAGAVIGVALLDLLPESLRLAQGVWPTLPVVGVLCAGFALYLGLEQLGGVLAKGPGLRGNMAAAALTAHSLIDGLGIGLAYKVSSAAGLIVAAAVLAHDCVDGANTVTVSLSAEGKGAPRRWLAADALAPLVGILLSQWITVARPTLALILSGFAGLFLFVGASELLPQALQRRPGPATAAAVLTGLSLIYAVVLASGG